MRLSRPHPRPTLPDLLEGRTSPTPPSPVIFKAPQMIANAETRLELWRWLPIVGLDGAGGVGEKERLTSLTGACSVIISIPPPRSLLEMQTHRPS